MMTLATHVYERYMVVWAKSTRSGEFEAFSLKTIQKARTATIVVWSRTIWIGKIQGFKDQAQGLKLLVKISGHHIQV